MNTTEEKSIDVISVLSEIIRKFERYNSSIETKSVESQEVSQKIIEFQKRLEEARTLVKEIPGIDQSKTQQLEHLESLKKQLVKKQELINKNADQLAERLSDSYLMRRAAQMVVSVFYRTKAITEESGLGKLAESEKVKTFLEKFQKNIAEEMQKAKAELEKKQKQ